MFCSYGCGKESIKLFNNGKQCCSERFDQCSAIIKRRIETRKSRGPWHSDETKKNIGKSLEGRTLTTEWKNKIGAAGKGRIVNDEGRENIRLAKLGDKNPMFGNPAWNTGLTSTDDPRILQYALTQTDVLCPARSHPNKNKGLKKQESLEILSRDDPAYSNFRKYRNRIAARTKRTYREFMEEINPLNLMLGKCGIDGAHQIDHIISVRIGFEQNISIEIMSAKENLQILTWQDNIKKYDGKGLRK
jgi:hypothetical protein